MAVQQSATPSTQESTQSTQQEPSQASSVYDKNIWGSLIPFNPLNKHVSRIDFYKYRQTYTIGRSRKEGVNDVPFPHAAKISKSRIRVL